MESVTLTQNIRLNFWKVNPRFCYAFTGKIFSHRHRVDKQCPYSGVDDVQVCDSGHRNVRCPRQPVSILQLFAWTTETAHCMRVSVERGFHYIREQSRKIGLSLFLWSGISLGYSIICLFLFPWLLFSSFFPLSLQTASSLSFSSDLVRGVYACASVERRSRDTLETRAAPVSRLQSRTWSFACLGRFARRTKKKERLLVVYFLCSNGRNII